MKDKEGNLSLDYTNEDNSVNPGDLIGEDRNKTLEYKTVEGIEEEWLPFYNDGTYNYIISKNYIDPQVDGTLNTSSGLTYAGDSRYPRTIWWTDSKGSSIPTTGQSQNNNTADIKTTGFWKRYEFNNTDNKNSKMAYSFLNKEWWTQFKGEYGADAIGTPTLEMYATAYNARYKDKNIAWTNGSNGLQISNSDCGTARFLDTSDDTFVIEETNHCGGHCWLASPYYYYANSLWAVYYNGIFSAPDFGNASAGLRPVVRLNKRSQNSRRFRWKS